LRGETEVASITGGRWEGLHRDKGGQRKIQKGQKNSQHEGVEGEIVLKRLEDPELFFAGEVFLVGDAREAGHN